MTENPQGIRLDEPYLNSEENLGHTFATGGISEFTVPEDRYFVFGDNRERSSDSRLCFKESPGSPGCETIWNYSFSYQLSNIEGKGCHSSLAAAKSLSPPINTLNWNSS
jgi:hypothetical protein